MDVPDVDEVLNDTQVVLRVVDQWVFPSIRDLVLEHTVHDSDVYLIQSLLLQEDLQLSMTFFSRSTPFIRHIEHLQVEIDHMFDTQGLDVLVIELCSERIGQWLQVDRLLIVVAGCSLQNPQSDTVRFAKPHESAEELQHTDNAGMLEVQQSVEDIASDEDDVQLGKSGSVCEVIEEHFQILNYRLCGVLVMEKMDIREYQVRNVLGKLNRRTSLPDRRLGGGLRLLVRTDRLRWA